MAPMAKTADPDGRSLQELAVDVIQDIHKLATGLAHAGVDPKVTQRIESTTELYSEIAKALASGPVGAQQPAQSGPAPAQPGPPPGQPAAGAPGQPPGATPIPPNHINGQNAQAPAQGGLHNTIVQMHQAAVSAAARR